MYTELPGVLSAEQLAMLNTLVGSLDMTPGPGGSKITPLGPALPTWQTITGIPGRWLWAGVVALVSSKQIRAHRDEPIPGTRIHIPLVTNEHCWSFHDGQWLQPRVGHCYEMNPAELHGAVNWGHTTRLHLIIDLERQ